MYALQQPVNCRGADHANALPGPNSHESVRLLALRSRSCVRRHVFPAIGSLWEVQRQRSVRCCASGDTSAYAPVDGDAKPYETLAAEHCAVVEVKKSKFLATAWPISSPVEVR